MKKVLAIALAVMMLATVAFAGPSGNIAPGTKILITRDKIDKDGGVRIKAKTESGYTVNLTRGENNDISDYILRSVSTDNYSVTNVKIQKVGKSLVEGVKINEAENRVEIIMKDDLNNTHGKDFEVTFKLKGKVKFTVKDSGEVIRYNAIASPSKQLKYTSKVDAQGNLLFDAQGNPKAGVVKVYGYEYDDDRNVVKENTGSDALDSADNGYLGAVGKKVSLPDLDFTVVGTVGYGKVTVSLGDDGDEELENLETLDVVGKVAPATGLSAIDIDTDVVKFVKGDPGTVGNVTRVAGSYTADAILTQEYGDALTLEARVYHNDTLYFSIDNAPKSAIISRLADSDADMDFYLFNDDKTFTTFNSNAVLYFNDADENDYVYEVRNDKLIPIGSYSEDDGCWVYKTRTLGQYVVSDVELKEFEAAAGEAVDGNPDTGANDVVGIATALAAVALVSAAAVSLKK